MELTDEVLKKVTLIEGENEYKYDDLKNNPFINDLLGKYFLTMSEYEFNKKIKDNKMLLYTDKRLRYISEVNF